jgi:plastocyanin
MAAIVAGCAGAPAVNQSPTPTTIELTASPTPTPSPSAVVSPSAPVLASPTPVLDSTTEPATEAPVGSISLKMQGPPPVFRPVTLGATAGDVTFFLENRSPRDPHGRHNLAIGYSLGDPLVVSDLVEGGASAVFTVYDLEPGEYVTWCTFPDHAALGQVGRLTVE